MTTNEEHFMNSFNDATQSQLCCGSICLPKFFKVTRTSELQSKPQFKTRQEGSTKANLRERTGGGENLDWLAKFEEFMRSSGQPNAESSSAVHSQDEGPSLDQQRTYVIHDEWQKAEPIYRGWPNLKTIPLNSDGDTALHLAVSLNRTSFFKGLMDLMAPEELEVQNGYGNTAFFVCTNLGKVEFAQTMLRKNPRLAMIKGRHERYHIIRSFPIFVAAFRRHHQLLQLLCPATVLDDLDFKEIRDLFFKTLENNTFDVAYALLEQRPRLTASRNKDDLTPLHVLARKPEEKFYEAAGSGRWGHLLIARLWTAAKFMEQREMLALIEKPSHILFDAAKSGNIKILDLVSQSNISSLFLHEEQGLSLLDTAILSRQEKVIIHLTESKIVALKEILMQHVDAGGNNILHLAGKLPPRERFELPRSHVQMQRELLWFKEMEARVPTALKTMRNNEGLTPKDIFDREHAELLVKGGDLAKDTANYGMLVATIIATIVFAASLTVPGHDVSPDADSSILQKKGWYIIFILSNSIALFSSSSSIIFFLSVLTSSLSKDEFISSLHVRLMFGVTTLFVATTTMVVAFTAVCFVIFNHLSTWVAYLVASLGLITVALFVLVLYTLFGDLVRSFYWSLRLFWPANYYQRIKSHIKVFIHMMKGLALKIGYKLPKMCQITKGKKHLQEDNPMAEP